MTRLFDNDDDIASSDPQYLNNSHELHPYSSKRSPKFSIYAIIAIFFISLVIFTVYASTSNFTFQLIYSSSSLSTLSKTHQTKLSDSTVIDFNHQYQLVIPPDGSNNLVQFKLLQPSDESRQPVTTDTQHTAVDNTKDEKSKSTQPQTKTADVNTFSYVPKMLIVSRHGGTTSDLEAIAETMGWEHSHINVESWTPFWLNHRRGHRQFDASHIIKAMCRDYDIISVSDVIWDSLMFLKTNDPECVKKLLLVTTNRFDILLHKVTSKEWHNRLNKALRDNDYKYPVITANNPYEQFFMEQRTITLPTEEDNKQHNRWSPLIPVIRSLGLSAIPLDTTVPYVENPPDCVYYRQGDASFKIYELAKEEGFKHECILFSLPYGGPTFVRKQHAPFVFMPYQVSVMKMWETVVSGVIMLVPDPILLERLAQTDSTFEQVSIAITLLKAKFQTSDPAVWSPYIDFYSEEFAPCSMTFSSWSHLDTILETKEWMKKEEGCRQYAKHFANAMLAQWHQLFEERFPHLPLPPITPEQRIAAKTLLKIDLK